ncbi:hypothetical protein Ocin01_19230 [Orchesella cincta]|uniref:Uncharacterized protein n=1 Tax=Orchesella cincta TaxID=48709 RepID=A0A1D2M3D8_ORCCI|nr:hypothetical protein Ocin01_19230 [Orchesella cincta]
MLSPIDSEAIRPASREFESVAPADPLPPPSSMDRLPPKLTGLGFGVYSCGSEDARDNDSAWVLSIWMIVSYADPTSSG